jgi:hypothetical protein
MPSPNDIQTLAACYQCIPEGMRIPAMIYLLQQALGNTETPAELVAHAAPLQGIAEGQQIQVLNYLLGQIVSP